MRTTRYAVVQIATGQVVAIFSRPLQVAALLARHGHRIGAWTVKGGSYCYRVNDMTARFSLLASKIRAQLGLDGDAPLPESGPLVKRDDPILQTHVGGGFYRYQDKRVHSCPTAHLICRRKGLRPDRLT